MSQLRLEPFPEKGMALSLISSEIVLDHASAPAIDPLVR
jgi:hypothetical protein